MSDGQARIEDRMLRIVRAHPDRLLYVDDRIVGLPIKREGPAHIAMGRGEIRVELQSTLELSDALYGPSLHESDIPKRDMRPWIVIVEFRRSCPKFCRTFQLGPCRIRQIQMTGHKKHESKHAVRRRIVRVTFDSSIEHIDRGCAFRLGHPPEQ